jgi:RNA polymerase sigma-70 factor (ECF subfamily)
VAEPVGAARVGSMRVVRDGTASAGQAQTSQDEEVTALVGKARQNDREAFGQIYRLFKPRVFRLARFYLNSGAEDAVAETFLRAWNALPRYRSTGAPFVAWLYGIARHVVADERNLRNRVESRPEVPAQAPDGRVDDRLALALAMEKLPREDRQIIELKFLIGLTNGEVAAALGKSVGAINTQQWRALRALRRLIEEK